jgi:hypothetical protein
MYPCQGDQKIGKKLPKFWKIVAKTVAKPKKARISSSESPNINIKAL